MLPFHARLVRDPWRLAAWIKKDQGVIWVHSAQKEIPGVIEAFQKIHTLPYIGASGTVSAVRGNYSRKDGYPSCCRFDFTKLETRLEKLAS